MTLVMAYVILIAAGVAAGAVLLEAVLHGRGAGARWVWVVAMAGTIAATLFAMVAPRRIADEGAGARVVQSSNVITLAAPGVPLVSSMPDATATEVVLEATDSLLPVGWLVATLVLLVALGIGQHRFRMERRTAREARIGGHDVLLTDNLGPAVAGVRRPVVFVPRWVLALDHASQQLLLAHEIEHVKRRDTSLLLFGAVTAAITPWNPVIWWMVRRLRLAVEQDCDARVLATHPGIRRYADLLLMAASRHGLTTRLLAAHFGEHTSDLLRRIEAMTLRNISWRRISVTAFVGAILVGVACETPRPDPVAPLPVRVPVASEQEVPANPVRSVEFSEQRSRCTPNGGSGCQISVIVQSSDGKELARYAGEIPVAHVPEGGVHKINVENGECGKSSCSLIWITLKPGALLPKTPLRAKSFSPTRDKIVELRADSSLELMKFESRNALKSSEGRDTLLEMAEQLKGGLASARIVEREANRVAEGNGTFAWPPPRIILRNDAIPTEPPNVIVSSSDGTELKRILAEQFRTGAPNPLAEIRPDDIGAIEVYKGTTCPVSAKIPCPLIRVFLKPGRDGAYRNR